MMAVFHSFAFKRAFICILHRGRIALHYRDTLQARHHGQHRGAEQPLRSFSWKLFGEDYRRP